MKNGRGRRERKRTFFSYTQKKWAHVQLEFIIIDRPISCKVEKKQQCCARSDEIVGRRQHIFPIFFLAHVSPSYFLAFSLLRDFQYSMLACCVCFFLRENSKMCVIMLHAKKWVPISTRICTISTARQTYTQDAGMVRVPYNFWIQMIFSLLQTLMENKYIRLMMMGREERSLRLFHLFQKIAMFGLLCRHLYTIKRR